LTEVGPFFIPKSDIFKAMEVYLDDLESLGAKKFKRKLSSNAINHVLIYIYWVIDYRSRPILYSKN
jgi:hypothetical protein